jgi:hypothetical protein
MKNNEKHCIALNTARNCLRYVIKSFNIKEIYLPYYTCDVVWQSVKKEKCKINFYHIDENFYPTCDFPLNAFILYTNYFGICAKNVKLLALKYKNLIVDNAQAFYMPKYGIASFNSLRKFFNVLNGAFLYSDRILDYDFEQDNHIFKTNIELINSNKEDFIKNELFLNGEDIKLMSNLTKNMFNSFDLALIKEKRLENFQELNTFLNKTNELNFILDNDDVPMFYPYLSRDEKIKTELLINKIPFEQYWLPLPTKWVEGVFQKHLILLPISQNYDKLYMKKVANIINS